MEGFGFQAFKIVDKDEAEKERISFDMMHSTLQNEERLNQKVKPTPYNGMQFKEGEFPERQKFSGAIYSDELMCQLMNSHNDSPENVERAIGNNLVPVIMSMINPANAQVGYMNIMNIPPVLIAMKNIISKQKLPADIVTELNGILYMCMANQTDFSDNNKILELYRGISSELNKEKIQEILGINMRNHSQYKITNRMAMYIAMSRNSTNHVYNEPMNIRRLNTTLMTAKNSHLVYNVQVLVDIYQLLFDEIGYLFRETMFHVIDPDWEDNVLESASLQVNAVLFCLNNCAYPVIYKVLDEYNKKFTKYFHGDMRHVRASIRCLSPGDYPNIVAVVDNMESQGIYLP